MGMDMGGMNGKMDLGAMKAKLNGNLRQSKMKDRMRERLKKWREEQARKQGEMMGLLAKQAAINAKKIVNEKAVMENLASNQKNEIVNQMDKIGEKKENKKKKKKKRKKKNKQK